MRAEGLICNPAALSGCIHRSRLRVAQNFCEVVSRMSRVQRLRSMGMDWAADLIEGLMTDKLKLQLEVARLKRELRERKGKK